MQMLIFIPVALLLACIFCVCAACRPRATVSATSYGKLDRAGVLTNCVLGLLYLPLSLVFSLSGMVGDGYVSDATPLQSALCIVIGFLGFLCVPVCSGGILASVLMRRRGKSRTSFAVQFTGLAYMGLILVLVFILEMV